MNPTDFPGAYARFLAPVRAKCRRLLGPNAAADDVAQEAFLRLWQAGPPLDGSRDPRTILAWLYLTSTRLALDALRNGRWLVPGSEDEPRTPCCSSPSALVTARALIHALANRAAPEELEAALLARVDALPQAEVARILGVSERTVRRLLESFDRNCAALREELTHDDW
jgi:RNA polymerase sigma-70 factor (ECF subfamily)